MIANVRVIPEGALFLIGGVNFLSFSASGLLSEPLKFSDDVEISEHGLDSLVVSFAS